MSTASLIFPHQLFAEHPCLAQTPDLVVLVEDSLFFGDPQYPMRFHKQKLWLHMASMRRYQQWLSDKDIEVEYVRYEAGRQTVQHVIADLNERGFDTIIACDPIDFVLEQRLRKQCEKNGLELELLPTPLFLNTQDMNADWRDGQKRWFMAEFYKFQRRRLDILMDGDDPVGGQWSFDEDNRKKVPRKLLEDVPAFEHHEADDIGQAARDRVLDQFPDAPGSIDTLYWPTSHDSAEQMFRVFLAERMERFGPYEDAIVEGEGLLWHAALTPALNIGLITPERVVELTLEAHRERDYPLNSLEGFLRQIVGWREFMRATYVDLGVSMRTTNHWKHKRSIPPSFWTGETGIPPIDDTIRRILETGYCHHIERLMVLGGFMFVCEFDPDEIYRWFMEMFVDSYDWVMVPNAYAMSQNADGGQITTKPYFSGSSYIRKMSNHPKGDWCDTWDALYWRWIWQHANDLENNPRWAMMVSMVRKMDSEKRDNHLNTAAAYLRQLTMEAEE